MLKYRRKPSPDQCGGGQANAFPEQRLIVRAATEQAMIDLRKLGVSVAVQESTEIGLRLAGAVLEQGER